MHLRQAAAAGRLDKHIGTALLAVRDATGSASIRAVPPVSGPTKFHLPPLPTSDAPPCAGQPLSDARLKAEIGTFIMGGFETTAHTLSFTLFALAANPHVQARLAAELAAAGLLHRPGCPARQLEPDDLRALPYLCNVLKESMRMYPVVAGIPRCAASRAPSRESLSCQPSAQPRERIAARVKGCARTQVHHADDTGRRLPRAAGRLCLRPVSPPAQQRKVLAPAGRVPA